MELLQPVILIISAIVLFIHGLKNFSSEIQNIGADKLKQWLGNITKTRTGGFLLGAVFTAVIQSSTATSVLTVSLVDSGVITFWESLAVLLGANVGTTTTAWIITLNSYLIGPFFIVLGTLISIIPTRISIAGKSIFYFGFIFFSLNLVGNTIEPIRNNKDVINLLMRATNPFLGVLYGIAVTVLLQSSSVVVGLVIVFISQGMLTLDAAIPIVIGANAGTTSTAFIASLKLSSVSKLTALSNFLFSLGGVVVVFPFMGLLADLTQSLSDNTTIQVAYAHLIFNLVTAVLFLILLKPIYRILIKHRWYKGV